MKTIIFALLVSILTSQVLSVSLGVYIDDVITQGMQSDRGWASMVLMTVVHQKKFGGSIEIFMGENSTCFDVDCIKEAVKLAVNESLDWKRFR